MLQFLIYLLHKQIIEMRRSQNLRCPFLVPSRRLWYINSKGLYLDDMNFNNLDFAHRRRSTLLKLVPRKVLQVYVVGLGSTRVKYARPSFLYTVTSKKP